MMFRYIGEGLLYLLGLPLAAFQCVELIQALPDLISNFTDWHQL